jgi:selenocysteine lyase/cysteine desulfurase
MPEMMPDKLESGTPNTVGIAGLAAGVRFILETGVETIGQHERQLRQRIWEGLKQIPRVITYGPENGDRTTSVISFNIEGLDSGQVSYLLDRQFDIATRAGLHCAPWAHRSIGTFKTGTVRIGVGYFNTLEDTEQVLTAIKSVASST